MRESVSTEVITALVFYVEGNYLESWRMFLLSRSIYKNGYMTSRSLGKSVVHDASHITLQYADIPWKILH